MFKPIELPYSFTALEPYYSEETLKIHYDTLYKGYIENLNKVQEKLIQARENGNFENIKCLEKDLSFNVSGVILHEMFFENMTPKKDTKPSINLMRYISKSFNNFQTFKEQFEQAASKVEASGWCLLVWVPNFNKLEILQCEKHQDLTLWGCKPLLVLDMWEHSYFLQYKANRPTYIDAFWNIVNWEKVNKRLEEIPIIH